MSIFFWKKKKSNSEPETAEVPAAVTSSDEMPAEVMPEEESAAEEVPAEEPAAEEASAEEVPAEEPAADEVPASEEVPEEEPVTEEREEETDLPMEEAENSEDGIPSWLSGEEPEEEETPAADDEAADESAAEVLPASEENEPEAADEPAAEESEPEAADEPAAEESEPEEGLAAMPSDEAETETEDEPAAEEVEPAEDNADFPVDETAAILEAEAATAGDTVVIPVEETAATADAASGASSEPEPKQEAAPEDDDYEERKPRRKSRALLWIFLLLLVIGGSYYYGMTYSETHFLENTYINGMEVSNMTAPEVEKILYQNTDEYELKITYRDGEVETITGEQIGLKVKPDGSVDRILQSQDHKKWYMCFFRRTDGEVELKTTYDPNRLKEAVNALPELQPEHMVAPSDAYIELQGTKFNIIPEVEGNYIEAELVKNAIYEAVHKRIADVVVTDIEGSYREPSVRAADKDIIEKCDGYNHMLAGSITWELPNGETMTVDKETTVNWLSQDEDGNYYRDEDLWEEKIEFWVDELARNVNTVGRDWSFDATGVGEITVSGGDYGYSVNKVDEREEVWDLLWDGETEEREPYFYTTQYNHGSGIGGTYIEANLSQQHVWIYVDGEMVCDTPCVSGNVNNGHGTPTGVYQILYKDTDTDLKGQQLANGQYSYISHVDYWMPFYGGCGFHDASWRSSFGGNIYKYDGSHGCINLPPSIAPKFYGYVRTGMPVVVFY